jgi:hypothetical protein
MQLARDAIGLANARLSARLQTLASGRRTFNRVAGGATRGATPPPLPLYEGLQGRKKPKTASPHSTKAATRRNERHSRRAADPQAFGRWRMPSGNVSRGEPRCTFVNEIVGLRLAMSVFPKVYDFAGDAVLSLVEPGLYKKGWHNDDSIA